MVDHVIKSPKVFQSDDKVLIRVRVPNSEKDHYREATVIDSWVGSFGGLMVEVVMSGSVFVETHGGSCVEHVTV